jgi:hypothetical protein
MARYPPKLRVQVVVEMVYGTTTRNRVDMEHLWVVFVLGPVATLAISYTPLGRALIERLRGQARDVQLMDMQDELERLGEQVAECDRRFDEVQDRLDFAERLLARGAEVPDEPTDAATPV